MATARKTPAKKTATKTAAKPAAAKAPATRRTTRSTTTRTSTTRTATSTRTRRPAVKKPVERPQSKAKPIKARLNMLEEEYQALTDLKEKLAGLDVPVKRGELLRAGILQLTKLTNIRLKNAIATVPVITNKKRK